MLWLKRAVVGTAVLIVLWLVVGLMLPAGFKVERSVEIGAPAARVYGLIADPRAWKRWSIWNQRDPAMELQYGGPIAGKGATWSWKSRSEGNGSMIFSEAVDDRMIGYRLSFPDHGMESTGLLRIDPAVGGAGVRVTWTNEGQLGMNPVNRWFGLMMDRMIGPDFEAGLANLKRVAEQSP